MCRSCVLKDGGWEQWSEVQKKINTGMRCGKSNDYFKSLLRNGCPTGRRHCGMCGIGNGGKTSTKGKGKTKRNPPPQLPVHDGAGLVASRVM